MVFLVLLMSSMAQGAIIATFQCAFLILSSDQLLYRQEYIYSLVGCNGTNSDSRSVTPTFGSLLAPPSQLDGMMDPSQGAGNQNSIALRAMRSVLAEQVPRKETDRGQDRVNTRASLTPT